MDVCLPMELDNWCHNERYATMRLVRPVGSESFREDFEHKAWPYPSNMRPWSKQYLEETHA